MCDPLTVMAALTIASTAVSTVGQIQSGKAQAKAIDQQSETRAEEIADSAGHEMSERARAARRERASLRAAGSAAGINLDTSGSFMASLNTATMNQYNDNGLISHNERTQQRARQAEAASAMSRVQIPSALEAALTIGGTAYSEVQKAKRAKTAASIQTASGRG
jgi:hypothetical protein